MEIINTVELSGEVKEFADFQKSMHIKNSSLNTQNYLSWITNNSGKLNWGSSAGEAVGR